jgi:menaquinone-specific isochorismate synthase
MTSTLRTLTVPLDGESAPEGLPSYLVRDDVLCWTRREAGLVGFGEAARFTATGPERFLEADIWWRHLVIEADIIDHVECPGTGPVAFGSFAFSKASDHESRLIVPEIVVGVRDGRAWLTQITADDAELTEAGAFTALKGWLESGLAPAVVSDKDGFPTEGGPTADLAAAVVLPNPASLPDPAASVALPDPAWLKTGSLSEEDWMDAVTAGVAEIRTGKLEKLVLARDIVATVPEGVNAAEVLRQLAGRYRECWTYGVDGPRGGDAGNAHPGGGAHRQARVLAGTLDRRDAVGEAGLPLDYASESWPDRRSSGMSTRSPSSR